MIGYASLGLRVNDLLGRLGIPGGAFGAQLDAMSGNPLGVLKNLQDAATEAAIGRGTTGFERAFGAGAGRLPPFGCMPVPGAAMPGLRPLCGAGYSRGGYQRVDLAAGQGNSTFDRLFNPKRRAAAQFERLLKTNPFARQAFEQAIGGRVVGFGRSDGKMTIRRFPRGFSPVPHFPASPLGGNALGMLAGMNHAILGSAAGLGLAAGSAGLLANPFGGVAALGLANMAGGMFGGSPFGALGGVLGGGGAGSWNPAAMPGRINNTNPLYERAHQGQVSGVLNDPSLTVEDKVSLMIMLIMKKMDKDIQRQASYINSIQQQQSNRGGKKGGGGGKKGGGGGGGGKKGGGGGKAPSIDVETMKMKRMIDKRSQMFDMLRQIIDKYNETAKGIIQSIGR